MNIPHLNDPPGRPVPTSDYRITFNENHYFQPGENCLIRAYAYDDGRDGVCRINASYLYPVDILLTKRDATDADGVFHADAFLDLLDERGEHYVCENTADDTAFATFNTYWNSSEPMNADELIAWASDHIL